MRSDGMSGMAHRPPPTDRFSAIPNGVDPALFSPGTGHRAAFALPEDAVIALFAGDLRSSRRNLDAVLKAVAATEGVRLAVAGGVRGSPDPAMGIADRVHVLGHVTDMPLLRRSVDPFGLVVLEALACGLPVITARTAGAGDILTEETGIVVEDPDNVDAITRALLTLVRDPARRRRMAVAARALAERYSWTAAAAAYPDVIEGGAPAAGVAQ